MASQFKKDIFDFGFLPILVDYLDFKNSTVRLQAAVILTYLCQDLSKNVEIIAKYGAFTHFVKHLNSTNSELASLSLSFLHTVISEFPHLHKYYDYPEFVKNIEKFIDTEPSKEILLANHKDSKIMHNGALGLRMLAILPEKPYPGVFDDAKVIEAVIKMVNNRQEKIQTTALLIVSHIINDKNVCFFTKSDIINQMPKFIKKGDARSVNLALQIIRKIVLQSKTGTSEVMDSDIFPLIIEKFSSPLNIQKEAAYLLSFFAINGNEKHISIMINKGIIEAYCNFLKKTESPKIVESILIGYYSILVTAENRRCQIFDQLEKCNALFKIEKLGKHEDQNIKKLSKEIMAFYHDKNDEQTLIVTKINALEPILILKEGNFVNSYYDISEVAKFAVENGKSSKIDDQNAIILLAQNLFSNGLTDEIAKSGILSALIEYMDSSNPDVKHGATILLAHIAYNSTKMVQLIVEEGAIPRFFKSLDSSNENVVVHSLIFFNTLVLSHPNLRNNYSELELVQNIHTLVDSKPSTLVLQYSTTLFYGLSRNKNPSISHEAIKAMLPVFSKFLQHPHYQIAGNSALTLAILTSNKENGYMIMFEEEDIQNLIELLNRQNEHVQTSTLQLISKIIDNSEHETQLFLDTGILQLLTNFFKNSDDDDIVFWGTSNHSKNYSVF
uniref:Uncharacterized protein n=1 Tax=Panagrolaimus superbus TaxID=310955 RepID=A0A914YZL1_9BILA